MIKVGEKIINFGKFPDGTCKVNIDCAELEPHAPIIWLYDSDEEWMRIWFLTQHCRDHEGYRRTLFMPYCNSARQDRVVSDDDVFTLKYFAQMVNALHYDRVEVFDAHSDVTAALINHVHVISPIDEIQKVLEKIPDALIALPDEGSMLRCRGWFSQPVVYGIKSRNWKTQKVEQLVLCGATNEIDGKNILIIDDIAGKGSTIYYMAKQLKHLGAKDIYVYVSHCENTIIGPHIEGKSLLDHDLVTKMYTTNSILRVSHPKIELIRKF